LLPLAPESYEHCGTENEPNNLSLHPMVQQLIAKSGKQSKSQQNLTISRTATGIDRDVEGQSAH